MYFRVALLLGHTLLLLVAAAVYVSDHGGIEGDYFDDGIHAVRGPPSQVVFNRWRIVPKNEPLPVQVFLCLNVPSLALARLYVFLLGLLVDEMNRPSPFGLSYASYIVAISTAASFLQWYWVGWFAERLAFPDLRYQAGKTPPWPWKRWRRAVNTVGASLSEAKTQAEKRSE